MRFSCLNGVDVVDYNESPDHFWCTKIKAEDGGKRVGILRGTLNVLRGNSMKGGKFYIVYRRYVEKFPYIATIRFGINSQNECE